MLKFMSPKPLPLPLPLLPNGPQPQARADPGAKTVAATISAAAEAMRSFFIERSLSAKPSLMSANTGRGGWLRAFGRLGFRRKPKRRGGLAAAGSLFHQIAWGGTIAAPRACPIAQPFGMKRVTVIQATPLSRQLSFNLRVQTSSLFRRPSALPFDTCEPFVWYWSLAILPMPLSHVRWVGKVWAR